MFSLSKIRRLEIYLVGTVAAFSATLCLLSPPADAPQIEPIPAPQVIFHAPLPIYGPFRNHPAMNATSVKSGSFVLARADVGDAGLADDPSQYDANTASGGITPASGQYACVIWDIGASGAITSVEAWGSGSAFVLWSSSDGTTWTNEGALATGTPNAVSVGAQYIQISGYGADESIYETQLKDGGGVVIDGPATSAPATSADPVPVSATATTITFFVPSLPVDATSFSIQRAPDVSGSAGSYSAIDTSTGGSNYTDTGLSSGTLYWYRLVATNGAGGTAGAGVQMRATIDYSETGRAIGPLFVLTGGDGGRAFTDTGRATDLRIITGADSGFPRIETDRGANLPIITGAFDGRAYAETGKALGPLTVLAGRTDLYNAGEAGRGTVATVLTGQSGSGGSSAFGEHPGVVVFVRPGGTSSMTRTELGKALGNIVVTAAQSLGRAARRELSRSVLLSVLTGRTDHAARKDLLRPVPVFILDGRQGGLTFSEARGSVLTVTTAATVQRYRIGETGRGSVVSVITGETDHAARRDRTGTTVHVTPGASFHLAATQHPGALLKVLTGASSASARHETGRGLLLNVLTGRRDTRQSHETGKTFGPVIVSTGSVSGKRYHEPRGSIVLVSTAATDHAARRDATGSTLRVLTPAGTQHNYGEDGRGVLVRVACGEGDLKFGDLVEITGDREGGPICGTAGAGVLIGTAVC